MKLILASKSPRRKQILEQFGYKFTVKEASFSETSVELSPVDTAVNNALGKAKAVFLGEGAINGDVIVLGADTVVCLDGEILGKPLDDRHAFSMLLRLSNRTHKVVTGWAIVGKGVEITGYSQSQVTFNDLELEQIDSYVKSGLPLDKAGSYGIQDGYGLVKEYKGGLNNVIGLPIEDIKQALDELLKN